MKRNGVCRHSSVGFVQIVWKEWNVYSNYSLGSKEEEKEEEDKTKKNYTCEESKDQIKREARSQQVLQVRPAGQGKESTCHTQF